MLVQAARDKILMLSRWFNELEQRLEDISEDIEVAIIGCYVNGPGESKAANIGLTGASPKNLLYVDGAPNKKISNDNLVNELEDQVRKKVAQSKTDSENNFEELNWIR